MLHTETVEAGTLALIKRLSNDPAFKEFVLVGGTALSLQLGHRRSIDIDLFSAKPFDPKAMVDHLNASYQGKDTQTVGNAVFSHLQGVKVDLIAHQYPWVDPVTEIEGIRMASTKEIGAMNAYTHKYADANPKIAKRLLLYHEEIDFEANVDLLASDLKWEKVMKRLKEAVTDPGRSFKEIKRAGGRKR